VTDLVAGVPAVLTQHTDDTLLTLEEAEAALATARRAREALAAARSDVPIEVDDDDGFVAEVLDRLQLLDRVPAAVAAALEHLDAARIVQPGTFGPPAHRTGASLTADGDLVSRLVDDRFVEGLRDRPPPDVVGALGLGDRAGRLHAVLDAGTELRPDVVDEVVSRVSAGRATSGAVPVRRGLGVVGAVLGVRDEWRAVGEDPLSTVGDRAAAATTSEASNLAAGLAGAKLGAVAGAPAGPVGASVGGLIGGAVGVTAATVARRTEPVARVERRIERRLAGAVDRAAGTQRERDRYDRLADRATRPPR
jgi:hypothetical protein